MSRQDERSWQPIAVDLCADSPTTATSTHVVEPGWRDLVSLARCSVHLLLTALFCPPEGELQTPRPTSTRHPPSFGKYRVLKRIAVGGMAEIYLARATGIEGFEKYVVVKRTLPQYSHDERFVRMFLDEARLAARLHHPNIAQVYDIGQADSVYFFAMEYVHGEDLAAAMRLLVRTEQRMPLEHAITVGVGAAAGLHYAHERLGPSGKPLRIIHRDVSPSNILITYDGGVKLVDFGIARAAIRSQEATRTGTMKGKAGYMSPEQCLSKDIDRRSDIFSLGILLYEMTTRTRLFDGQGDYIIMHNIVNADVPSPSSRVRDYPPALERIVMRALKKDPNERYPTCQEMLLDLERFASTAGLPLSSVALSRYMKATFGDRPEPWREMRNDPKMANLFRDDGQDPWRELPEEPEVVSMFGHSPEPWHEVSEPNSSVYTSAVGKAKSGDRPSLEETRSLLPGIATDNRATQRDLPQTGHDGQISEDERRIIASIDTATDLPPHTRDTDKDISDQILAEAGPASRASGGISENSLLQTLEWTRKKQVNPGGLSETVSDLPSARAKQQQASRSEQQSFTHDARRAQQPKRYGTLVTLLILLILVGVGLLLGAWLSERRRAGGTSHRQATQEARVAGCVASACAVVDKAALRGVDSRSEP